MPIVDAQTPPSTDETHYVVYFASGEPSWCPDCRDALPALNSVFGADSAPTAYLVRVGSPSEWRAKTNKYRQPAYDVQCVPTVVRVDKGKEVARLGDFESQQESSLKKLVA